MSDTYETLDGNPDPIEAYLASGPAEFPGELDLTDLRRQLLACEDQPLTPGQQLGYGWMSLEHAVGLSISRGIFTRERPSGTPGPAEAVIDLDFQHARRAFQTIIDDQDADPITRAQAYSARGSLPFWKSINHLGKAQGKVRRAEAVGKLDEDLRYAASELIPVLERGDVPDDAVRYCQSLGLKLLFMAQITNHSLVILDVPPRFNRLQPDTEGWDSLVMDLASGTCLRFRTGEVSDGYVALEPRPTEPIEPPDPQRLLVLRTAIDISTGKPVDQTARAALGQTSNALYAAIRNLSKNKDARESIGNAIRLWATAEAARTTSSTAPIGQKVPELTPPPVGTIDLSSVTSNNLLAWYDHTPVSRLFTYPESAELMRLINHFEEGRNGQRLNPRGTLTYARLLTEVASSAAVRDPVHASLYIDRAQDLLVEMQQELPQDDSIYKHGALVELARIDMMRSVQSGAPANTRTQESFQLELSEQLSEALRVNKNARDQELKAYVRMLMPLLLDSLLIMRIPVDPPYLAIPSMPRHHGTAEAPGWNVTVWSQKPEAIALQGIHRIRVSADANTFMRQGNVVVVPEKIAGIDVDPALIRKRLVDNYRGVSGDKSSTQRVLDKWAAPIGEYFLQAINLAEATV